MSDDFPYPELLGRTVADPKTDREHLEAIVVAADKVRMHMVAGNYHYTDFTDFGDLLKAAKHHIESQPNNSDGVEAAGLEQIKKCFQSIPIHDDDIEAEATRTHGIFLVEQMLRRFLNIQDETGGVE